MLLRVASSSVRSFSLVHEVEEMGLVIGSRSVCSANPLISNSTCIGGKTAACISVTLLILILILILVSGLPRIALSQLSHEVAVEHGLSHLGLLLRLGQLVVLRPRVETTHAGLVEKLLLV